jgi:hypothetical protein
MEPTRVYRRAVEPMPEPGDPTPASAFVAEAGQCCSFCVASLAQREVPTTIDPHRRVRRARSLSEATLCEVKRNSPLCCFHPHLGSGASH